MPKALVTATTYPHYEVPKGYTVQIDDNGDVVFRDARGNEHKPDPQIKDRQKQPPPFQDGIWQIVNTGLPSGASHMSRFQYNVIVPVMPAANASTIHYCWGGLSHWDSALNYDSLAHPVMRCIYPGYGDA